MHALLNLCRCGAPVYVAPTRVIAHAHDILVLDVANACHGLIFQNRRVWVLELAFLVICAFQNGKIRPKPNQIGRSLACDRGRSLARELARNLARDLAHSLARALARSFAHHLAHILARNLSRTLAAKSNEHCYAVLDILSMEIRSNMCTI